jgi:hypothetical protein
MQHYQRQPGALGKTRIATLFAGLAILLSLCLAFGPVMAQDDDASREPGTVIVEWTTESEVDLAGFNLYRSESPEGPYVKVNEALIPASPDPLTGGDYVYTDTTVTAGTTYYYKLEDVELDGKSTMHGPIEVAAQANEAWQSVRPTQVLAAALVMGVLVLVVLIVVGKRTHRRSAPGS